MESLLLGFYLFLKTTKTKNLQQNLICELEFRSRNLERASQMCMWVILVKQVTRQWIASFWGMFHFTPFKHYFSFRIVMGRYFFVPWGGM